MSHQAKSLSDMGSSARRGAIDTQQSNGSSHEQPLKLNTALFRKAKGQNTNRFTPNKGNGYNFIAPQFPLVTPQRRDASNSVIVSTPSTNVAVPSTSDSGILGDTQKHSRLDLPITPDSSFSFHLDPNTTMDDTSFTLDTSWNGSDPSSLRLKPSNALGFNVKDGGNAQSGLVNTQAPSAPTATKGATISNLTDLSGVEFHLGDREINKRVRESSGPKQDESKRQRTGEVR